MGIVHPQEQQAVQTAATTTRAQAQQQQDEQPQELRRSIKGKPKMRFKQVVINKKDSNSTTAPPTPTCPDMSDLEWTLTVEPQDLRESEVEDWERVPRATTAE